MKLNKTQFLTPQRHERNYFLDLLKIICILGVIFIHVPHDRSIDKFFGASFWIYWSVPLFMVISGYTWSLSYQKRNIVSIKDGYNIKVLLNRFLSLFIPFIIMFMFVLIYDLASHTATAEDLLKILFVGNMSFGGYYLFLLFQWLLIFPLFYYFTKKYGFVTFMVSYVMSAIWFCIRWLSNIWWINSNVIVGYLPFFCFGTYLGITREKHFNVHDYGIMIILVFCLIVGVSFMIIVDYTPIDLDWFIGTNLDQRIQNFLGCFYLLPICYVLFKCCKIKRKWPTYVGARTYGIYIVQMCFFRYVSKFIDIVPVLFIVDMLICVVGGLIFHVLICELLTEKLIKQRCFGKYLYKQM